MIGRVTIVLARLRDDPVMTRWLIGNRLGLYPGRRAQTRMAPPYLAGRLPLPLETPAVDWGGRDTAPPSSVLRMRLPGLNVDVMPDAPQAVFDRAYSDNETHLAVQRFAWVPLAGVDVDPAWVDALWRAWQDRFATSDDIWVWHPYTAAERAINILDFARRHGVPGDKDKTLAGLAAHGPAIAGHLEYFGEHNTSNHLMNNGRGLYRLGLALGLKECAEAGLAILTAEAGRIFHPSGVLREGSSHYHLLYTRNLLDVWLAARRHGRAEAGTFEAYAKRALSVARALMLPGGLPLIGDVSPDCPPAFLESLATGEQSGWLATLDSGDRAAVAGLVESAPQGVLGDGWWRAENGGWAVLSFCDPDGWPHTPGHGHQDAGSFELHDGGVRVVVDPGRGAYGEDGEAALYRSGAVHNTVAIDDRDPYPPNKPYYDDAYRRAVCGRAPVVVRAPDGGVTVRHDGFSRLSGVGSISRSWSIAGGTVVIHDRVDGVGRHKVRRALATSLAVELINGAAILGARWRVWSRAPVRSQRITLWRAYGEGVPGTQLVWEDDAAFPFDDTLTIERLT